DHRWPEAAEGLLAAAQEYERRQCPYEAAQAREAAAEYGFAAAGPAAGPRAGGPETGSALGTGVVPGPVLHLDGYQGPVYHGVPAPGQHTREVLTGLLGRSATEVDELARAKVVGWPDATEGEGEQP